jgi:hypothetical protein
MSKRSQIYLLVGLVMLAGLAYFASRNAVRVLPGVLADDGKFEPLSVQEPQLRLDLLEKLHTLAYSGTHRNIFSVAAPPVSATPGGKKKAAHPVGPVVPPPPPPLVVPVQFFGQATMTDTGKHVAFFTSGDDVLVVEEGSSFLDRFRLLHIGNDAADVQEISTGRHATLALVQPPTSEQ